MAQAVETRLGAQDAAFVPELAERLADASPAERPVLRALFAEIEGRSAGRFAAVAQHLRAVLAAGSVDKMEAVMSDLVRSGKVGVGFLRHERPRAQRQGRL